MRRQFNHLQPEEIDFDKEYYCYRSIKAKGFTILMRKVLENDRPNILEEIKYTIENDHDILNKQNSIGMTALMIACINSDTSSSYKIVKLLIDYGSDVNIRCDAGTDALFLTIRSRCYNKNKIVKLLVDAGYNLNSQDKYGRTALMYTCYWSMNDNNYEIVCLLINSNLDLQDKDGATALMLLCRWRDKDCNYRTIARLVNAGCNIYLKANNGKMAYQFGYCEGCRLLSKIIKKNRLMMSSLMNICCDHILHNQFYFVKKYVSLVTNRDITQYLDQKNAEYDL